MAQAGSSSQGLLSQAIAEVHLGRFEEAESALQQALAQFPDNADVLANCAVLAGLSGKDNSEYLQCVTMHSLPRGLLTHCIELFKLPTQRIHTSKDWWRRTSYSTPPLRSSRPARHNKKGYNRGVPERIYKWITDYPSHNHIEPSFLVRAPRSSHDVNLIWSCMPALDFVNYRECPFQFCMEVRLRTSYSLSDIALFSGSRRQPSCRPFHKPRGSILTWGKLIATH